MWPFSSVPDGANCIVVETIPKTLDLQSTNITTLECFEELIAKATKTIHIVTFCCNLRSTKDGENILSKLCDAARRGVKVVILVDYQSRDTDKEILENSGVEYFKVKINNTGMSNMLGNFWTSDKERLYVGSASLTGGSLTTIKNLGLYSTCSVLAKDLENRFDTFKKLIDKKSSIFRKICCTPCMANTVCGVPLATDFHLDYSAGGVFFSDSPDTLLGCFRTLDYDVVIERISKAQDSIDLSLMSFVPIVKSDEVIVFWPNLLNALLEAAINRSVKIRVLVSHLKNNNPFSLAAISTLNAFSTENADISVRYFSNKDSDTVNNTKLLVVDSKFAHLTVANFDGTHYKHHSFVSANAESLVLVKKLSEVFNRDWESKYSVPVAKNIN
ncbi:eev envelope phospholipase [Pteropox virus]|uniref:Eev envelope phospholipase n=1 Tax=Pteropox virus TaxID=1873698 RepID=A0A1B1MRE3_9POXV|nr:eev envelope phospholipase [Pteropox virus]ANS71105.1 eev envelope phospholipase [Pteropox virus]